MYKEKIENKIVYFDAEASMKYFNAIENKNYKLIKIYKDTDRSIVKLIEIDSKKLIYKIPVEKNTRKWQRFLSIFRGSESKSEAKGIDKVIKNGFKSPKIYLVCETKKFGMIFDSYILMENIESKPREEKDIGIVAKTLNEIHQKGFYHGDVQMNNFILTDKDVYIIDTKFDRLKFGKLSRMYEYFRLEKNVGEGKVQNENYDKNSIWYKIVSSYDRFQDWLRIKRNFIRGRRREEKV